jgi:phage shock protein E
MINFLKKIFLNNSAEIKAMLKDGAYLVDVSTEGEFNAGHASGSINIPLNTIQSHLGKFKNKKNIILCCQSGMRSSKAKSILNKNGILHVVNAGTWMKVDCFMKS